MSRCKRCKMHIAWFHQKDGRWKPCIPGTTYRHFCKPNLEPLIYKDGFAKRVQYLDPVSKARRDMILRSRELRVMSTRRLNNDSENGERLPDL